MAMGTRCKNLLVVACLLSFVVLLGAFNATKARILVVHSQAADSPWVQAVDAGMRQALDSNRRPVSVSWMYLDLAAPTSRNRDPQATAALQRMLETVDPDVLIAVDDEANALISRTVLGAQATRILYVSLDRPPESYGYQGSSQVSGITEALPLAAIRDAATTLFSDRPPRAAVIGVDTPTGRAELAQVQAFDWGGVTITDSRLVASAPAWREFVSLTQADLLVVLSTHALPETTGRLTPADQLVRWTQQRSGALPIGSQIDFVPMGGALSFAPPPAVFGQQAIHDALNWLDARSSPGAPAPTTVDHFQVGLRSSALAARGLRLPPIYTEAAREAGALYP
jgi:hypothetical protein